MAVFLVLSILTMISFSEATVSNRTLPSLSINEVLYYDSVAWDGVNDKRRCEANRSTVVLFEFKGGFFTNAQDDVSDGNKDLAINSILYLGSPENGPTRAAKRGEGDGRIKCFNECYNLGLIEVPKHCSECTELECLPNRKVGMKPRVSGWDKTYAKEISWHCTREGISYKSCCAIITKAYKMKSNHTLIPVVAELDNETGVAMVQLWAYATPRAIVETYRNGIKGIGLIKDEAIIEFDERSLPEGEYKLAVVNGPSEGGLTDYEIRRLELYMARDDPSRVCRDLTDSNTSRCNCL